MMERTQQAYERVWIEPGHERREMGREKEGGGEKEREKEEPGAKRSGESQETK